MTSIVINKRKLARTLNLDLEQFTHTWLAMLPEAQARVRIAVGQPKLDIPILVHFVVRELAVFSEKTGGNLIAKFRIFPSPLYLGPEDTLRLTLIWNNF